MFAFTLIVFCLYFDWVREDFRLRYAFERVLLLSFTDWCFCSIRNVASWPNESCLNRDLALIKDQSKANYENVYFDWNSVQGIGLEYRYLVIVMSYSLFRISFEFVKK